MSTYLLYTYNYDSNETKNQIFHRKKKETSVEFTGVFLEKTKKLLENIEDNSQEINNILN